MDLLAPHILTHLGEHLRAEVDNIPHVSEIVERGWQQARATLQASDAAELGKFLADKLNRRAISPAQFTSCHLADLALAWACGDGNLRALEHLEEHVFARVLPAILRAGQRREDAEDALQHVRERLLVGTPEKPPSIFDYNGSGRLESWIRVAALRTLQNSRRKIRRETPVESTEIWDRLLPPGDAELEHLKSRYQDDFRRALREAVAGLSSEHRVLLRQHVVEGVRSTQLASLYQVHRATVSRRIVVAQETLLDSTRARLIEHLQITAEELTSVLRLIQSQFETGIGDLLLEEGAP